MIKSIQQRELPQPDKRHLLKKKKKTKAKIILNGEKMNSFP